MTRARGSLLVLVGPRNSHHSLQGDVLILREAISRGAGAHYQLSSSPFRNPRSSESPKKRRGKMSDSAGR